MKTLINIALVATGTAVIIGIGIAFVMEVASTGVNIYGILS